eukprot:GHRR01027120.1.p2 GENE.GHRR01027120.1~~GHRR01027120.1.p2  ORF type:complete len:145 (+),score=36.14 GHRR01027120.1:197-631(+)
MPYAPLSRQFLGASRTCSSAYHAAVFRPVIRLAVHNRLTVNTRASEGENVSSRWCPVSQQYKCGSSAPITAPPAAAAPAGTPDAASSANMVADGGKTSQWYAAVGLSAMAALICSVDRAAMSVAILPMSEQFHWSDSIKGAINR